MATTNESLAIAIEHHRAGRLGAAEATYLRILEVDPSHADALHLLGLVQAQTGRLAVAAKSFSRALGLRPDWPEALANLGNALAEMGRPEVAEPVLRRAVDLQPTHPHGHNNLGNALFAQGKHDEAIDCYRRALDLWPEFAEAIGNLGRALEGRGDPAGAIDCYRRAVAIRPELVNVQYHLALALEGLGDREGAIDAYRRAVALRPGFVEAWNNLGNALRPSGRLDEAVDCYRRTIELRPELVAAHYNLGLAMADLGRLDEAVACYRQALSLAPELAEAHADLGNALKNRGELEAAVERYRRALELRPASAAVHNNLGNALRDQGLLGGALESYHRALELEPSLTTAHSNLLYTLHYCPGVGPSSLAKLHAEYDERHAVHLRPDVQAHRKVLKPRGPVRLGFVSPDLAQHPVGSFLVRVLEQLGGEGLNSVCYSDRVLHDAMTRRLQAAATGWQDVFGLDDERLAEVIRADGIDVLFDLAGHTARNRLLVFARKPAPVQITWIGYEGTTGLAAMDYLIADHRMVPPGAEQDYRERVLRMPDGYLCYDPPAWAPPAGPPPCLAGGSATFASFSNPAKITEQVIAAWARVLGEIPSSRLLLKYRGMDDRVVRDRFLGFFAARGVGPERLELRPWSTYSDYLATYAEVDIVLDTFPFSGSATTCEALWMGVPVVTCPGETFASRHSLGHLTQVGLTETIAQDLDEYVGLAVALAGEPGRLAEIRLRLRGRMAASPLCDGKRFARNLKVVLHDACVSGA